MASAGTIDQIKIRRGKSDGTIEEKTYDIGVSGNVAAINVSFDDTIAQLNVSNVQRAIEKLKSNFQDGVDSVYIACADEGSTPTDHSLSAIITAIHNIGGTPPTGTYEYDGTEAPSWIAHVYDEGKADADASYVYNKGHQDGYQDGYNDGVATGGNPIIAYTKINNQDEVISADLNDTINNVQVINGSTTKILKVILYGQMEGSNPSIKLNNDEHDPNFPGDPTKTIAGDLPWGVILNLPPSGVLNFYQVGTGSASNGTGKIFITVLGATSYTNTIATSDASGIHVTEGTFTAS